ncbi:tyrosine-type recombinase/integrase [Psychrosphaera sp. 1_MG-2023]|uniref:tyrosine-type recombinase/integrase n=1 Tax=Psychrosphaera sp. 1_MG-2023 TaxID=3062643 RepID=UPI0026E224B8|nr:tyrosine-type recombinase/integrase [Psychrosphaera sp. 1_MG-2023]MDO6719707.1 tyrosine-type recombinase/integrase [Psychrosphaera sp. 1_MG-2023]
MNFSIQTIKKNTDDESIILVDKHGQPHFAANTYLTAKYVKAGAKSKTCDKVLRSLAAAFNWGLSANINFQERLTNGRLFSRDETSGLIDFLGYQVSTQKLITHESILRQAEENNTVALHPTNSVVNNKQYELVSNEEKATRMRYVYFYIKWHVDKFIGECIRNDKAYNAFDKQAQIVLSFILELIPSKSAKSDDEPSLEGFDFSVLDDVEGHLKPDSESNPFSTDFLRHRNYLLWRFYRDTGGRRNEILNVKVEDVIYSTNRLAINVTKTIARTVPIKDSTTEAFDKFITEYWSKLPLSVRKQGYIFISEKGSRISTRQVNRIFERIRNYIESVPDFFAPHGVRRTVNDLLSDTIDKLPAEERMPLEQEENMRNRIMGWCPRSKMAAKYSTGKLTWDRLRTTLQFELGHPYTKAGLRKHPEIVNAWDSAKERLKVKIGNQKPRNHGDGALAHAYSKIAKLEATIARLESEKELFLDQFLRWSYNAVAAGMTE